MSNKTRKHIWPGALVVSFAIVGVLAALLVLTWNPMVTEAHGGGTAANHCSDINNIAHDVAAAIAETTNADGSAHTCANPGTDDGVDPGNGSTGTPGTDMPATGDMITSDSSSRAGGAAPELKVVITSLSRNLAVGSSIVLYLEDDYQEPETIPASSVYFVAESPTNAPTGNGARVYTTIAPKIDTGAYFDEDKKDISIRVFIPDMCTNATDACEGSQWPHARSNVDDGG